MDSNRAPYQRRVNVASVISVFLMNRTSLSKPPCKYTGSENPRVTETAIVASFLNLIGPMFGRPSAGASSASVNTDILGRSVGCRVGIPTLRDVANTDGTNGWKNAYTASRIAMADLSG